MVGEVYDVFDKKTNIGNLFYQSYNGNDFVNVPLQKFVLVSIPHLQEIILKSNDLPF